MRVFSSLFRRNVTVYLRDRSAVFFSMLSPLILFALYVLFLADLPVQGLRRGFPEVAESDIRAFVMSWVFAGMVALTAITAALGGVGTFVEDSESGRFNDFLVAPLRRWQVVLAYLASTGVISVVQSGLVVAAALGYFAVQGYPMLSARALLEVLGYTVLSCLAWSAISSFAAGLLRTSRSFSAVSTIVGTFAGFLAGAFITAGNLPLAVNNVINSLPFAQSAMLLRVPFTEASLDVLAEESPEIVETLSSFFGIRLFVGDWEVTPTIALVAIASVCVVFFAGAVATLARRIR